MQLSCTFFAEAVAPLSELRHLGIARANASFDNAALSSLIGLEHLAHATLNSVDCIVGHGLTALLPCTQLQQLALLMGERVGPAVALEAAIWIYALPAASDLQPVQLRASGCQLAECGVANVGQAAHQLQRAQLRHLLQRRQQRLVDFIPLAHEQVAQTRIARRPQLI